MTNYQKYKKQLKVAKQQAANEWSKKQLIIRLQLFAQRSFASIWFEDK